MSVRYLPCNNYNYNKCQLSAKFAGFCCWRYVGVWNFKFAFARLSAYFCGSCNVGQIIFCALLRFMQATAYTTCRLTCQQCWLKYLKVCFCVRLFVLKNAYKYFVPVPGCLHLFGCVLECMCNRWLVCEFGFAFAYVRHEFMNAGAQCSMRQSFCIHALVYVHLFYFVFICCAYAIVCNII